MIYTDIKCSRTHSNVGDTRYRPSKHESNTRKHGWSGRQTRWLIQAASMLCTAFCSEIVLAEVLVEVRVPLNAVNGPVLVHYLVVLTGLQTS
jgi:hypothetical protein